jgi:pSer/pThr/pTyr-binding forkhead associated (FHA) protein
MDDSTNPLPAAGLPQGPHFAAAAATSLTPLRLLLQPSGMALELTRPDVLVGRHSDCDVRLPLPDVSRKHCRFQFHGGCWQVVDMQSLNGVFVNDQPVERVVLRQGDRVRIGGFIFVVELPVEAAASAEAESLAQSLFKNRSGSRTLWPPKRNAS